MDIPQFETAAKMTQPSVEPTDFSETSYHDGTRLRPSLAGEPPTAEELAAVEPEEAWRFSPLKVFMKLFPERAAKLPVPQSPPAMVKNSGERPGRPQRAARQPRTSKRLSIGLGNIHIPKSKPGKWIAGTLLAGVVLEGFYLSGHDTASDHDSCTDATHESVAVGSVGFRGEFRRTILRDNDGDNWDSLAAALSGTRYYVSPTSLRLLNPTEVETNQAGKASDTIKPGTYCFALPAPVLGGMALANGGSDMQIIATENHLSLASLYTNNPSLSRSPTYVPSADTMLNVSSPYNPINRALVEQINPYAKLNDIPNVSPAEFDAIVAANEYAIGEDAIGKGARLKLPLSAKLGHVSSQAIIAAYYPSK